MSIFYFYAEKYYRFKSFTFNLLKKRFKFKRIFSSWINTYLKFSVLYSFYIRIVYKYISNAKFKMICWIHHSDFKLLLNKNTAILDNNSDLLKNLRGSVNCVNNILLEFL